MRGQERTLEEKNELFNVLEEYLKMGFSLKKACSYADLPYSTIRDIVNSNELLRAKMTALQNIVNVTARENIIKSIKDGNLRDSKWWLEKKDRGEFGRYYKADLDDEPIQVITEVKWVVVNGEKETQVV